MIWLGVIDRTKFEKETENLFLEIACALSQESSKQNFDSNENGNSINSSIKQDKGKRIDPNKTINRKF
jgi:hypothetical protein